MSSPWPRTDDSWFRLGRVEVTSTVAVVGLGVIGLVLGAIAPWLLSSLALLPSRVLAGEAWRVLTWPLIGPVSIWAMLNLLMLWFFGTELEGQVGRVAMARLYVSIGAILTLVTLVLGLLTSAGLVGLGQVSLLVLLIWVAEYPRRPFFFGIPAWVVGLALVAIQLLSSLAARDWGSLLILPASVVLVAFAAARVGLLREAAQWFGLGGQAAERRPAVRRPKRSQARAQQRVQDDRARLDELLDRINEVGIQALSEREKKELGELRARLRGQR